MHCLFHNRFRSLYVTTSLFNMPNTKTILKALIALSAWSFLILGLFKLHGQHEQQHSFTAGQLSGRFLLQKDARYNIEATSTTTDRIPIVDNRAGKNRVYCLE